MPSAKRVADLITTLRGLLAVILAWLGHTHGRMGLSWAVWLLILSWTGDSLDGSLARRSRHKYATWIGDHDLEIDVAVSGGLLLFMVGAGLVDSLVAGLYVLAWLFIFWRWGWLRSLGMLVQAPIYGGFIWCAVHDAPTAGWWLVGWIAAALIITWPRFPNEIVPGFLNGMHAIWAQPRRK
ncbi:MAG: hypothetical protein ACE5E7_01595 [Anaerolineae bacterium]